MKDTTQTEKEEILRKLDEWRRLEEEDSQFFMQMTAEADSELVRALYRRLSYDSLRHSGTLSSIMEILSGSSFPKAAVGPQSLEKLKSHIKTEDKAIKYAESIVERMPDKSVKMLLKQIIADERQHHKILSHIMDESQRSHARIGKTGRRS